MADLIKYEDDLRTGTGKLNKSIKQSKRAEDTANDALRVANEKGDKAIETAETMSTNAIRIATEKGDSAIEIAARAEGKSDSTQSQLDQIIIEGDSSVEAAQARVKEDGTTFSTLQERLNSSDTQQVKILKQIEGIINVKQFGAVGNANYFNKDDGLFYADSDFNILSRDDTQAFKDALNAIRENNRGGHVYVPTGNYLITDTIDYYLPNAKGFTMYGDNMISSVLQWNGGPNKAMFSNKQPEPNKYQYGVFFKDLTFMGDGKVKGIFHSPNDLEVIPSKNSVGLHVDMMRNEWGLTNVRFDGWTTGLDIGIHSEGGLMTKCYFGYNLLGANAYGNQADALVFHASWFAFNHEGGLIISSPRTTVDSCFFSGSRGKQGYRDIKIGYQKVRPEDIGRSAYIDREDKGASGIYSKVINNYFEYNYENNAAVEIVNLDSTNVRSGNISFENNSWALYESNCAVLISNQTDNLSFTNNRITSNSDNSATLMDVADGVNVGVISVNEPHISNVIPNNKYWLFLAKRDDFNNLPMIADLPFTGAWLWINNSKDKTKAKIDVGYKGRDIVKISHTPNDYIQSIQLRCSNYPEGLVYVSFDIGNSNIKRTVHIKATDGLGTILWQRFNVPVGEDFRNITFGFNNPSKQSILITIDGTNEWKDKEGSFEIRNILVKNENEDHFSYALIDTMANRVLTRRYNQIFDIGFLSPNTEILNYDELADGYWFLSQGFFTIAKGERTAGSTSVNLVDVSGIEVGDYLFFKPIEENGVSRPFVSTVAKGNKITSISDTVVTLSEGIPFNILIGQEVMACKVYRGNNAVKV